MPLVLSTQSLSFLATGASAAQSLIVSEAGYSGAFSATTITCQGIASIAAQPAGAFLVTPIAAGSCTFVLSDSQGQSKNLTIFVTTTSVGGS
jgi:hypothetical protein